MRRAGTQCIAGLTPHLGLKFTAGLTPHLGLKFTAGLTPHLGLKFTAGLAHHRRVVGLAEVDCGSIYLSRRDDGVSPPAELIKLLH